MLQILATFLPAIVVSLVVKFIKLWKKDTRKTDSIIYPFFIHYVGINALTTVYLIMQSQYHNAYDYTEFNNEYFVLYFSVAAIFALLFCVFYIVTKLRFTKGENKKLTGKRVAFIVGSFILFFIGLFFVLGSHWATTTFGLVTPEQVVYHIMAPLEGTNTDFVYSFINEVLIYNVLLAIIFVILLDNPKNVKVSCKFNWKKEKMKGKWKSKLFQFKLIPVIVFLLCGFSYGAKKVDLKAYYDFFTSTTKIVEKNYVDPNKVKISFPEKKRNLIYIYVESLESTFISRELGGQMDKNIIEPLTDLAREGIHFSDTDMEFGGAYQGSGTGWTIAGMVAQTTGLPLKINVEGNDYGQGQDEKFLPGVTSLGDILKKEGYIQTLMIGSEAVFGGREAYFSQHGDYQMMDYHTAVEREWIPEGYKVWWGFEDSKLFEFSKEVLLEEASKDEPFNFTMLTANTHHVDGYLEGEAPTLYPEKYSNVYAYSATQIENFVRWIQEQDFYSNTTIIISGDHLSMDVNYFEQLEIDGDERRIFNLILNPASTEIKNKTTNRLFTSMDLFPTTLHAMGVEIQGDKLGLGTNLFSDEKTLPEKKGKDFVNKELGKKSFYYNKHFLQE